MELRQLRYFVAVARHLHFGRAAQELNMAQPPLSQQIKRLENELGVQLLERTSRQVELTEDGRQLLEAADRVLSESSHFVDLARRLRNGHAGRLRIGFAFSVLNWGLAARLRSFREAFPGVDITVVQMRLMEQAESLTDGTIDVGFCLSTVDAEHLSVTPLGEEPIVAVLPVGHRLVDRETVRLADLSTETFVGFHTSRSGDGQNNFIAQACVEAGFRPRFTYHGEQIHTMIHMVAAGFGVTLVPSCDQAVAVDGAIYRAITPPSPTVQLSVLRHRHWRNAIVDRLVEHVTHGT
ncbi:LysR family transcriptional regulator [Pseudonocardia sp. NPDC049635]|uniref:LysR family transcriptional regulator n=1 Tax=Pseudonocardia sp. NPDC049635 TaxID=3155506 RepID=UPI0033EB5A0B